MARFLRDEDILLTRREAADYVRRTVSTLERWAVHGGGPAFRVVGGKALYPLTELRRFCGVDVEPERRPNPDRAA